MNSEHRYVNTYREGFKGLVFVAVAAVIVVGMWYVSGKGDTKQDDEVENVEIIYNNYHLSSPNMTIFNKDLVGQEWTIRPNIVYVLVCGSNGLYFHKCTYWVDCDDKGLGTTFYSVAELKVVVPLGEDYPDCKLTLQEYEGR